MKFLLVLLFTLSAHAGLPPTTTKGSGDSVDVTTFKLRFPNIPITHSGVIGTVGTVSVAGGGTGATTLTSNNVILGNGTSAVTFVAPGTSANVLMSNGTTWASTTLPSYIANAVVAPGVTLPKTCFYIFGGGSATLASPTICTTGTCVEIYDSCSSVSPPSWTATGVYLNVTVANGTFANSSAVRCECRAYSTVSDSQVDCRNYFSTGDQTISSTASGGYVFDLYTTGPGGGGNTALNSYVTIKGNFHEVLNNFIIFSFYCTCM